MADGGLNLLIRSAFDASGITAATNSINKIDSQIARVVKSMSKFSGLLAGGAAGAAAFSFLKATYDSYRESEKAVILLTKAMQNLGDFSKKDIQAQVDFADKLQRTTAYTDEQIMAIQTQLVTYGLYGEELKKATVATLDLAVKTGSTESAAKLMGKAFLGQTETLGKYGIKIDSNVKGSAKYSAVLEEVQKHLGDLAEAEGSALGPMEQLSKSMDTLYEKVGKLVAGPLDVFVKMITKVVDFGSGVLSSGEKIAMATSQLERWEKILADREGKGGWISKIVRHDEAAIKSAREQVEKYKKELFELQNGPGGKPGKPLDSPEKDEDWEKYMSPEQQAKRLEAVMKDQRNQVELMRDFDAFTLSDRGQMYTRFWGKTVLESRRSYIAQAKNAEDMKIRQENVLRDLEQDYITAGRTFSGGFKQAMDETQQNMGNWKDNWNQVIGASIGPAKSAIHDFFTFTGDGFMDMGKLAKGVFQGILGAFLDMVERMAAKAAIYGIFSMFGGGGLLGGSLSKFLFRADGGPVPGAEGRAVPIMAHGGEFVLSANVVKAIKSGSATSGLAGGALAASGAGANVTLTQNITIAGGAGNGNVREICRQIADAGRKGVVEALDAAKVLYKQGYKRSGETAL